jgi:hypothetical protein
MLDLPVNIELLLYRMQDNTYTLYKMGLFLMVHRYPRLRRDCAPRSRRRTCSNQSDSSTHRL